MRRAIVSVAALLTAGVSALSEFSKQNVRANFGDHRLIALEKDQLTDVVHQILHEHYYDDVGHHDGKMHLKITPEALEALLKEGVEFQDHTEEFISKMERNLNTEGFVCTEDAQTCAAKSADEFYNSYQTLDSLYARYQNYADSNPELATFEHFGFTYEEREQKVLWIGDQSLPLVYYFCGIHAREWITPMFCSYMAETLLDSSNAISQRLLKTFSFAITPVGNPDGYVYTHTTDNSWRKTRKPNEGSRCVGTDPNRNYAQGWGGPGSSSNPCSDTYRGVSPFDQNCTANIKSFTDKYQNRLIHVNDVHAYGEYWMSPYAGTTELPPAEDWAKMDQCNHAVYDAILATSGLPFKIGSVATTIYEAAGGAVDYFYSVNGIVHSYTYEARGAGLSGIEGFQPPTENIMPSNLELFAGLVAALDCIDELELSGSGGDNGSEGGDDDPSNSESSNDEGLSGLAIGVVFMALVVTAMGIAVLSVYFAGSSKDDQVDAGGVEVKSV